MRVTDAVWLGLVLPSVLAWVGLLVLPWLPWLNRERLGPQAAVDDSDFSRVTVLIPARDEADVLARTLAALRAQAAGLKVIVVDDLSSDGTAQVARNGGAIVVDGNAVPRGWAGKLWALEQGLRRVDTPLVLLLDADIELKPGMLAALLNRRRERGLQFVSVMADLRRTTFWDRLLLPAFVYYFRLIYPFALSNAPGSRVAAAAGGCVLVEVATLRTVGAFSSLRGALIDDCTLARRVKVSGGRTWMGVSRGVVSLREYGSLASIYRMVARSAYTQLRYSAALLAIVTVVFVLVYWLPIATLVAGSGLAWALAWVAVVAMVVGYLPTLRYYDAPPWLAVLLPVTGTLYLCMTWGSALRYWRGVRSTWKGRSYVR
ncbi:MAG TPA: glycosyltransferase [Nevskiaceae bacterium]